MHRFFRHWPRIVVTLIPLLFALMHVSGVLPLTLLNRLDNIVYDARLRATMPRTVDERIVIVDIDEKSLAEVGRWPWNRQKMANLVNELIERQKVELLGFDVVFAEADDSSGLKHLTQLAQGELRDQRGFVDRLAQVSESLDYDALFAKSLQNRPVIMGYYFTSEGDGRTNGAIPEPVMGPEPFEGKTSGVIGWTGFGANLENFASAAPLGGFFNAITEEDGVVRSLPLMAQYRGSYYESLSLAMFRRLVGMPKVLPGFSREAWLSANQQRLESIVLTQTSGELAIPVDERVATLIPFRGPGGAKGGSFRYVSASDVLQGKLSAGSLAGKIVLLGTTAPGLLDLRVTPVGQTYPGVETHANVIAGFMDGRVPVKPDYASGFEFLTLVVTGLALALVLPLLSATRAVVFSFIVIGSMTAINFWLYLAHGLVLPLASVLVLGTTAFALNMSYGYFVESKSKRKLADLFGTYVPPELVDEMVKNPESYSMTATTRELTVMFCDMRGFTNMSETMEPTQLQGLLNTVFSRLTDVIRQNRGTIDKYMGDCVMAFWGAPVDTSEHASLAVKTALEMTRAVHQLNAEFRLAHLPEIGIGIGLNTGTMCVGDMGSDLRRSYTVIGDAVNLGSRLEGLSKTYGCDIVVSEYTRDRARNFVWQELDKVRVKGKEHSVTIFSPEDGLSTHADSSHPVSIEMATWALALQAYREQQWTQCDLQLSKLQGLNAQKFLYRLYAERVLLMRSLPFDPDWDGATNFQTK